MEFKKFNDFHEINEAERFSTNALFSTLRDLQSQLDVVEKNYKKVSDRNWSRINKLQKEVKELTQKQLDIYREMELDRNVIDNPHKEPDWETYGKPLNKLDDDIQKRNDEINSLDKESRELQDRRSKLRVRIAEINQQIKDLYTK